MNLTVINSCYNWQALWFNNDNNWSCKFIYMQVFIIYNYHQEMWDFAVKSSLFKTIPHSFSRSNFAFKVNPISNEVKRKKKKILNAFLLIELWNFCSNLFNVVPKKNRCANFFIYSSISIALGEWQKWVSARGKGHLKSN